MGEYMKILESIGKKIAWILSKPRRNISYVATCSTDKLEQSLRPGDVLLVEGSSIFSGAIKYLTQSCWSHSALYVGPEPLQAYAGNSEPVLVEADINEGIRAIDLSAYASVHTRICRPVGLQGDEIQQVIAYAVERIGYTYDLRNILDLARYLLPAPPVPLRFRRSLLALGSGDPTRAICSSLIAQAFQSVRYPILPEPVVASSADPTCRDCRRELHRIRHHSLFTPRDFDVSPYFQIVKPTIEAGFDHNSFPWEMNNL